MQAMLMRCVIGFCAVALGIFVVVVLAAIVLQDMGQPVQDLNSAAGAKGLDAAFFMTELLSGSLNLVFSGLLDWLSPMVAGPPRCGC